MVEWIPVIIEVTKLADSALGNRCPNCRESSYWLQKDEGKTWITGKQKIKCGHCQKIFKI